jgi:hypothetical protein
MRGFPFPHSSVLAENKPPVQHTERSSLERVPIIPGLASRLCSFLDSNRPWWPLRGAVLLWMISGEQVSDTMRGGLA